MSEVIAIPDLAPGCFGSALMFKSGDLICGACVFAKLCEPAHIAAQTALREKFGIVVRTKGEPRKKQEVNTEATRRVYPESIMNEIRRVEGMNLDIVRNMKAGINPFVKALDPKRCKHLLITCLLLLRQQTVSDKMLIAALTAGMKLEERQAKAFASISKIILSHVGLIEDRPGEICIRKDI